jgi:hypothetical protein
MIKLVLKDILVNLLARSICCLPFKSEWLENRGVLKGLLKVLVYPTSR